MKTKLIDILSSKKTKYVVNVIVILMAYYGISYEIPKRLVAIHNNINLPKEILDNPEIIRDINSKLETVQDIIF